MITIKDRKIDFIILPRFGNVLAEIYNIVEFGKTKHNISLLKKEFGGWNRKPIKNDYIKARKWVDEQLEAMKIANHED